MKIFLTEKSYFTFRGEGSSHFRILGIEVYRLMQERLNAERGEFTGEGVLLDPVYPFLTRERLFSYLDGREGSYRFPGGAVLRAGCPMSQTPRPAADELGLPLFTLNNVPAVLAQAAKESAELHMKQGALVEEGAIVDYTAVLREGAAVRSGSRVHGACVVGENAEIVGSDVEDSVIGAGTTVRYSTLSGAKVGKNCTVGPYAYLRAGSDVGDGCRVGDFVEIKNAKIGKGTKVSHLAYVGDADVGGRVNIGCGAVFVNYDGKKKSRTKVGDGCFIGSNCNLVAPLEIGDGAFVAAGSTLTKDLRADDFCIARAREVIKPNRGKKYYDPD